MAHKRLKVKHFKNINWVAVIVAISVTCFAWTAWVALQHRTNQANLLKKLNEQSQQLDKKIDEATKANKSVEELQKQKADLEKQLQAKRAKNIALAEAPPKKPVAPPQGVVGCGDNVYKQFIYKHESGCRTNAINSIGCIGLGQACPGSKLPCVVFDKNGHIVNYGTWDCQDAYFSNYAIKRYGSWENAYYFWLSHRWW